MYTDSKYTKDFVSDQLTDLKYNQLVEFAVSIRNFKNRVSEEVNQHLLDYLGIGKFEFITRMRKRFPKAISSYFDSQLYTQVYTSYQNRFDALQRRISFKFREFQKFNFYKRATNDHKKGDFKSIEFKEISTPLSVCLTYLARYGNSGTLVYIQSVYNQVSEDKQKFYDNILRCCQKFGFDRLMGLALRKRARILDDYSNPVKFNSLNFSGKTSLQNAIVSFNKNRHSKISGFITISVPFRKGLDIPVKISGKYHGQLADFGKGKKAQFCYTLKIDELKKRVTIQLCKDGQRYLPENKTRYVGVDVNVKHNLFALSDGSTYDFDRKLVSDYIKCLKQTDSQEVIGKRKQIKLQTFQRKIKQSNQELISKVCKDLKAKGFDHIVLEDLDNSFGRSFIKNLETGEKYTRLTRILNIGSLKDEFKHIAANYDIAVSFVQAEYTS